jgi:prevent-host-death family protein
MLMIVTATEFKNRLGQYLDAARTNPIVVEKTGRKTAVLISIEEFERLTKTEDEFWAQKALASEKEGYVGTKASMDFLMEKNV